ncbi:aminotransferase class I/II-fold pyridoxal phosphate-dependent enzyme [Peptoniphilus sp. KCTC 25270]|uniref:threonine aldolase family protein n=1 Tax=Peptoniphilus sp. KCTC 25270 TaxID=2897414 RepID=UPI001E57193E|nr:aminotransferase class I/II-fold pyridoxal phosphate-dependent enzyme [Peptoniphilus sp. KCTC 25270]MCD1147600.1 aminotransferase class I/II-fold pyridoxal phosphate-dependent enzyme [Peptoniphilus sp. KCTC 25270]
MNNFRNDYHDLCHPKVLESLLTLQGENNVGYGYDGRTANAIDKIQKRLGKKSPVFFVQGGTAANVLAISFCLLPHKAVIAVDSGHIVHDEVGSIEANGHKVLTIPSEDGKMDPEALEELLNSFGDFHNVLPGMIYISNSTETGMVYTKEEIKKIYDLAKEHEVYLYIDGARMGAGLASEECDIQFEDMTELCDIFSIGGTKNGALFGEALVFNNEPLAKEFNFYMKQQSSLLAKGYLYGAQFEALFTDDLLFEIGEQAQEAAKKLAEKLESIGVEFAQRPVSNQIFVNLPTSSLEALAENTQFEIFSEGKEVSTVRFVTTYETKDEEIESLGEELKKYPL